MTAVWLYDYIIQQGGTVCMEAGTMVHTWRAPTTYMYDVTYDHHRQEIYMYPSRLWADPYADTESSERTSDYSYTQISLSRGGPGLEPIGHVSCGAL